MSAELGWFLLGIALVIVELMTGTFYLLILGIAAIAGAVMAYFGAAFAVQVVVVAIAALIGVALVRARRKTLQGQGSTQPMDIGQTATFEAWVSEPDRLARVQYRGATWEALVEGAAAPGAGAVLHITAMEGSRLRVSSVRG